MADEQPPKRDVNEHFTLDVSDPTSEHDGPLAHLLAMSPLADQNATSTGGRVAPRSESDELPGITDVSGLEDLYVTTAEVQLGERPPDPSPPVDAQHPTPSDLPRSVEPGGRLLLSTEAGSQPATSWSSPQLDQPYPAPLVPHAVPTPVAPNKSVRVPGQERRRGALQTMLDDIPERRWFWSAAAGAFVLVVAALLVAGDLLPSPFADDRTDVVADESVPAAPIVDEATETSEADTSSSTGAGTGGLDPDDPTTSVASTTASTAPTSTRRVVTTARPTVRSTTTVAPASTTATSLTTTTVASSTTATTAVSSSTTAVSSSTTDTSSSTSTDTSSSTSTDTTSSTTDTTDGTSSTTDDDEPPTTSSGSSGSSISPGSASDSSDP